MSSKASVQVLGWLTRSEMRVRLQKQSPWPYGKMGAPQPYYAIREDVRNLRRAVSLLVRESVYWPPPYSY